MHIQIQIQMQMHIHIQIHIRTCTCTCTYAFRCLCTSILTCLCACVPTYLHTLARAYRPTFITHMQLHTVNICQEQPGSTLTGHTHTHTRSVTPADAAKESPWTGWTGDPSPCNLRALKPPCSCTVCTGLQKVAMPMVTNMMTVVMTIVLITTILSSL